MANAGPNTQGSQFFICHGPRAERLPKNYSIFGKVTAGLEVLDAIAGVPVQGVAERRDVGAGRAAGHRVDRGGGRRRARRALLLRQRGSTFDSVTARIGVVGAKGGRCDLLATDRGLAGERGGDPEAQAEELTDLLSDLPPDEIVAFDRLLHELLAAAYRWDLWGAAYIINGGCSDDGFEYFRAWLVAQGERTYREALADPETLVDRAEPDATNAESLLYAAGDAYRVETGRDLPASPCPSRRADGRAVARG